MRKSGVVIDIQGELVLVPGNDVLGDIEGIGNLDHLVEIDESGEDRHMLIDIGIVFFPTVKQESVDETITKSDKGEDFLIEIIIGHIIGEETGEHSNNHLLGNIDIGKEDRIDSLPIEVEDAVIGLVRQGIEESGEIIVAVDGFVKEESMQGGIGSDIGKIDVVSVFLIVIQRFMIARSRVMTAMAQVLPEGKLREEFPAETQTGTDVIR